MPASKPRSKRPHAKVPTGCLTCRQRRVKCDEERPACRRCRKIGWTCQGYDMIRFAKVSDAVVSAASTPSPRSLRPSPPVELRETAVSQDLMLLEYFQLHVLPNLSGSFDSQPWYAGIGPILFESPAVFPAAMALGALLCPQEQSTTRSNEDKALAIRNYNLAIKSLSETCSTLESTTPNEILLTVTLFTAFELYQNHFDQGMTHLTAALKFVDELRHRSSQYPASWRKIDHVDIGLCRLLERLDIQLSTFTSTRIRLNRRESSQNPDKALSSPGIQSLEEASDTLTSLRASMRELVYKVQTIEDNEQDCIASTESESLDLEVARQLDELDSWDKETSALQLDTLSSRDQQALRILQTHCIACKLQVANCLNNGVETLWDNSLPDFERLLDLLESIIDTNPVPTTTPGTSLPTSYLEPTKARMYLDMGIIPPAYLAAIKCRDRALRRRALSVLKACKHREGAWDAALSALQAEAIFELEERDSESQPILPERCRLHRAWYDLVQTGLRVVFCKRRSSETDGRWIEYEEVVR